MDISEFRSVLFDYQGLQKLDRYKLRFPVPPIVSGFTSNSTGQPTLETVRWMDFFCNTSQLPGVALATRPITRYGVGASEKKPVFPVFNDLLMTFYNDSGSVNLQFFQEWLSAIANFQFYNTINDSDNRATGQQIYELSYKEDYAVEAELHLYDVAGNVQYVIAMRDFFPVMIPEIIMSWENVSQFMQISCMFSFTDWYIVQAQSQQGIQPPVSALG